MQISRKIQRHFMEFARTLCSCLDHAILHLCWWLGYRKASIFFRESNWNTFDTIYWIAVDVALHKVTNVKKRRFWLNFLWPFLKSGPHNTVQQNGPLHSKTFQGWLEDTFKFSQCNTYWSWKQFCHVLTYSPLSKVINIIHFSWPTHQHVLRELGSIF